MDFEQIDLWEKKSDCKRKQVGCYIKLKNGSSVGAENRGAGDCSGEIGNCGCSHAERRAIEKLDPISGLDFIAVTSSPCLACAQLLVFTFGGAGTCFYREPYRDPAGINHLKAYGWKVLKIK